MAVSSRTSRAIRNLSLSRKLVLTTAITSSLAIILALGVFFVLDIRSFRAAMVRDLEVASNLVVPGTSAALAFGDNQTARETLGHLAAKESLGLGEHRAQPVTLVSERRGVVVLTRVLAADGRQHAEVRIRITLATGEAATRVHLARLIVALQALLKRAVCPT